METAEGDLPVVRFADGHGAWTPEERAALMERAKRRARRSLHAAVLHWLRQRRPDLLAAFEAASADGERG